MIDSDVKKELDLRLARGSISTVEYKKLLLELGGLDNIIAQYRELKLYEEFIINENEKILLNQIISVDYRHSESQTMVNGIPGPKRLRTDLKITIKNKKNIELWQASALIETPKEPLKNCRFAQQSFKNLVVNFNIWQFFHQNNPFFSKISPFLGLFSNFRRNQASTFISIPSNDIGNRGQKGQASSIFG